MTFLDLCKFVFREGGITGEITSVTNQTGEALRVVEWVKMAYMQLLNDQSLNWNFLRNTAAVQLTAGKGTYTFAELNLADTVQWDTRSMRVAVNADLSDETFLAHMRFPLFREFWMFSTRRTLQSRPLNVAVDDDTNLCFGPIPDRAYWVSLQTQGMPSALAEDDDVPIIPARFHDLIGWIALRHYGMFEAAPEVVTRADLYKNIMMQQLELDQSYEVVVGGPIC